MTGQVMRVTVDCFLLRYPATVTIDSTRTKYVFEALPFVAPGETFSLYKTALLGHVAMPNIMLESYKEYLAGARENATNSGRPSVHTFQAHPEQS